MEENPVQILEIRAADHGRPVTVTAAVTADGSRAIFAALSEQLDRRSREPITSVDDALELRDRAGFVERFEPLATAGAHAMVRFSEAELRACLLELADYASRVDGEHYQPAELRERLQVIGRVTPVLLDANSTVAAVAAEAMSRTAG